MIINKKLIFGILVLALAVLACGAPTPTAAPAAPNLEATQLAATIVAMQSAQTGTTQVDTQPSAPTSTPLPEAPAVPATPSKPTLSVSVNTNCRSGPGLKYPITGSITIGGSFEVVAQAPSPEPYVIIRNPGGGADCWAWLEHATIAGDISGLSIIAVPPIPLGSISGFLWLEDCDDTNPGNTCINNSNSGFFEGDGVFNNEPFISGAVVQLFSGICSSTTSLGTASTASTDTNGGYKFDKLEAGTYCVIINSNFDSPARTAI